MEFGIFNSFWDKYPNHLPFLNLMESDDDPKEWNLQTSISKLYSILNSSSNEEVSEGLNLLLQSEDWRPHLIASVSLLAIDVAKRDGFIDTLWNRLFRGSWISPQILVVLSLIDRDFTFKAEKILTEGFKVNYINISPIEHHVSRGGTSERPANGKVIAAIHYLLDKTLKVSIDCDLGGALTKEWSESLSELTDKGRIHFKRF